MRALIPALLLSALLPAPAFAASLDIAGQLQAEVLRCWVPPLGASGKVTVSFDLDETGRLTGPPRVDGFASPGVGQAAVHAVSFCAPYRLPQLRFSDWQHNRITLSLQGR